VTRSCPSLTNPFRTLAVAACALAVISIGCSSTPTAPTATTPSTPTAGTDTFASTIAPQGGSFHIFTATQSGAVSIVLSSTVPPGAQVGVGIGIPNVGGVGCSLSITTHAAASGAPALTASVDAGDYCAGAFDIGNVSTAGLSFVMQIAHP
jgi:hypothetical protein